jgi:hypothetical protein
MQPKNVQFVKQYRAELTLDSETTCSLNSTSRDALLANVGKVLGGDKPTIQSTGNQEGTELIYYNSHMDGTQPVGWIAEFAIPQGLSVKNVTATRFAAQRAA